MHPFRNKWTKIEGRGGLHFSSAFNFFFCSRKKNLRLISAILQFLAKAAHIFHFQSVFSAPPNIETKKIITCHSPSLYSVLLQRRKKTLKSFPFFIFIITAKIIVLGNCHCGNAYTRKKEIEIAPEGATDWVVSRHF